MEFNVTREQWIDRFVIRMSNLKAGAEPAAFVEAIASLLESNERWSALREAALSRVRQYDWRPICERLLEAYAQLSSAS